MAAPPRFSLQAFSISANSPGARRRGTWRSAELKSGFERVDAMAEDWLDRVKWDEHGLVPAIAQEMSTNKVLTLAWVTRESLAKTAATGEAHYWSRSRNRLWKKGEQSGNVQTVREIRLDCDEDVGLRGVEQAGGIACHTGGRTRLFQTP